MQCVEYREFPPARRFGVELELSNTIDKGKISLALELYEEATKSKRPVYATLGKHGWAETRANNYWHVKYDSTCGPLGKGLDSGWEVASFIGTGPQDIAHIAGATAALAAVGSETNPNCGLHVHVETTDFTPAAMGVLIARWLKIEPLLLAICTPHRNGNTYCQTMRRRMAQRGVLYDALLPKHFWLDMMPTDLNAHNNMEKRYAINPIGFAIAQIHPSHVRNTVELRLPECVLDAAHVKNWVRLIVNFVHLCASAPVAPPTVDGVRTVFEGLQYLGLEPVADFAIFDEELADLKVWFLKKLAAADVPLLSAEADKLLAFVGQF
jgi:hypothetical protein